MIDFQSIHASQLQVYRNFQQFKSSNTRHMRLAQAKLQSIRHITGVVQDVIASRSALYPPELSGAKVNLLV
ncbi:hypothetical protein LLH00_14195 [bacterium]|nr:hypothetical protein [bacterium]